MTGTAHRDIQQRVFKCLYSWLQSGNIPVLALENCPLLDFAFEALKSEELFDMAVDVVCEIIRETREVEKNMPVINKVYPKLLPLRVQLKMSGGDDEDVLRGICRIFTEAGEAYTQLVAKHFEAFHEILEGILECIAYKDLDIVKMTFNFWYGLAELLSQHQYENSKPKFQGIFSRLETIIIQHLRYPDDLNSWTASEKDEFRDFRHEMGDVLKDCCLVLGVRQALEQPCCVLEGQIQDVLSGKSVAWQDVEAPLFSFRTMGSMVDDGESQVMPRIMALLTKLPDHPKIRYAATLVIGRYTQWTSKHPEFLQYQLSFISNGFAEEQVVAASAMALKYFCKDCKHLLVDFLPQLHSFYVTSHKALSSVDLFEVTEALAHVVAAVNTANLLSTLQTFCHPIAQDIHLIVSKGISITDQEITTVSNNLERIAIFFENIEHFGAEPHPTLPMVNDLMPLLDQLISNYADNSTISESLCKCYKSFVDCYQQQFEPFLAPLLERLGAAFSRTHLSCYIWVSRHCIRINARRQEKITVAFFDALAQVIFEIFKTKKVDDIPDGN